MPQMHWGGLGTPPALHVPRQLPKRRCEAMGQEPTPSLTHEPQAPSTSLAEPRGHGDGHPCHQGTGATLPKEKEAKVCRC